MKCPHCQVSICVEDEDNIVGEDDLGAWKIGFYHCPSCDGRIIYLVNGISVRSEENDLIFDVTGKEITVYPRSTTRAPCPPEVPTVIAEDYNEACLVLTDSPKASAALSRRCLQNLLREVAKTTSRDLADQIQEVISKGTLPSHIADMIDAVRVIGNFAAHPLKSKHTGDIVPVEPEEAEWNLEVLIALFDFYCVQPVRNSQRKAALNLKLQAAGKPPLK